MNVLGIICARKGSKRLRHKHWLGVSGMPMFAVALDAAGNSDLKNVVLSSDDRKMWRYINDEYPEIWWSWRAPKLAKDRTPIHLVLQDVVNVMGGVAEQFDAVAFIPANVPTVTAGLIDKTINALAANKRATAAMTVRTVRDHPEWMWRAGKYLDREFYSWEYRVQDLPTRFIATGSVNIVRLDVLMKCRSSAAFDWLGQRIVPVLDESAIEVHDRADYERAKEALEK